MRQFVAAFLVGMMALGVVVAPAAAYDWPSTNEANMANGGPYVHLIDSGPGWVELEFVDPDMNAKFELRPDGHISPRDLNPDGSCEHLHGIPELAAEGECRHSGWEVEESDGTETGIFGWDDGWLEPQYTIEVRKAGGAERDTDFNWVVFEIPPVEPDPNDLCISALNGVYPDGYEVVTRSRGGSGNQIMLGTDASDVLQGGSGGDILCGFGGDDILAGGSGNDYLDGGAGEDILRGNSGNDTMINGETNRGGSGLDTGD